MCTHVKKRHTSVPFQINSSRVLIAISLLYDYAELLATHTVLLLPTLQPPAQCGPLIDEISEQQLIFMNEWVNE